MFKTIKIIFKKIFPSRYVTMCQAVDYLNNKLTVCKAYADVFTITSDEYFTYLILNERKEGRVKIYGDLISRYSDKNIYLLANLIFKEGGIRVINLKIKRKELNELIWRMKYNIDLPPKSGIRDVKSCDLESWHLSTYEEPIYEYQQESAFHNCGNKPVNIR